MNTTKGSWQRPSAINQDEYKEQYDNIFGGTWLLIDVDGTVIDEFERFFDAQNYKAVNHQGDKGLKIRKK